MRSSNVGMIGLALLGGAALVPMQASATASYSVDVDYALTATSLNSGLVFSWKNYVGGQSESSSYYTEYNASHSLTRSNAQTTGATGGQTISLTGSASGTTVNPAYSSVYNHSMYDKGVGATSFYNVNTMGTVLTVSNVATNSSLTLNLLLDSVLQASVDQASTESAHAGAGWALQMQTSSDGGSTWGGWTPASTTTGELAYSPDWSGGTLASTDAGDYDYTFAGGDTGDIDANSTFEDIALLAGNLYRFRLSIETVGFATSEVPVPAALPLLGAALGGLGLVARRRKAA